MYISVCIYVCVCVCRNVSLYVCVCMYACLCIVRILGRLWTFCRLLLLYFDLHLDGNDMNGGSGGKHDIGGA